MGQGSAEAVHREEPESAAAGMAGGMTAGELPGTELPEIVVLLDTGLCEPSFVRDRLEGPADAPEEGDPTGIAALAASIAACGQAVPILVRPAPDAPGRYQIAYGHRRWLACRKLGRPVRALVRPLDDEALVIAQGQENNARRDLSFIERAHFAAMLVKRGLPRTVIGEALGIDKTALSRLLAVAEGLPEGLAEAIGRAPKAGRSRWLKLVALCEGSGTTRAREAVREVRREPTDVRFKAVFDALLARHRHRSGIRLRTPPEIPAGVPVKVSTPQSGSTIITIGPEHTDFADFLCARLGPLHAEYRDGT